MAEEKKLEELEPRELFDMDFRGSRIASHGQAVCLLLSLALMAVLLRARQIGAASHPSVLAARRAQR